MGFFDELSDLTSEAISTFGKKDDGTQLQLVWDGRTIDCYEEDSEEIHLLMDGGTLPEFDLIVRARRADFGPNRPRSLQSVVLDGATRKIHKVLGSTGDPEIRLALMATNQRK